MVLYIRKRNGKKALFTTEKIKEAMHKAFQATLGSVNSDVLKVLTQEVVERINEKYEEPSFPSVEHVQDIVENVLLVNGHLEVAKAYIVYRARHKELREFRTVDAVSKEQLMVVHSNGTKVPFRPAIVLARIERLAGDLSHVKAAELVEDIVRSVYEDMPLDELEDLIVNTSKQRIELHYDYSKLASRLVLDRLYRRVLKTEFGAADLVGQYQQGFANYIRTGIEEEMLDPKLAEFDLEQLAQNLFPDRDKEFFFLGTQTLVDRYLLRHRENGKKPYELPQYFWMRVAMGISLLEDDPTRRASEFYEQLSQMNVVSSTPTLFNSGTLHPQMSSCYLNTVEDSMEGIFKNFSDDAQLSKWAGGIGTDWTPVRAKGASIRGTNGASQGVIPFLKIYNDVALAVNQGGKRKGAMCAYLEMWHGDVEEFLELRKNTGDERRRTHDIHTAVYIPDLFMKRVREKGKWTLFSPDAAPRLRNLYGKAFEEAYEHYESQDIPGKKTIGAVDLWRKLLTMLYETGHPWLTFKDAINVRSPQDHVGMVHNSNLCTEITLNTSADETAVCNLASINMSRMVKDGKLDEERLRGAVNVAMRMLDNVVDNNYYPTPEAKNANMRHRPVGLGMMGYQDALYQLGIEFASEENLDFADESMEIISHQALKSSAMLAKERGAYSTFKGSKWDRDILPLDTLDLLEKERGVPVKVNRNRKQNWEEVRELIQNHGLRNSNTMAIAPTATISNIAGTTPCVEPTFKNLYMKENLSGNFVVINRYLVDALEAEGLWNSEILNSIKVRNGSVVGIDQIPSHIQRMFRETFEVEPLWVLEAAARRSKWIDQSASTNVFMKTTSGRVLAETYTLAWELGLKTTYYLRTLAASQVSKTVEDSAEVQESPSVGSQTKPVVAMKVQQFQQPLQTCGIDDPDCEACQ